MDRTTLFSMQAALLMFMGCVIWLAWRRQQREAIDRSTPWAALGFILGGLGLGIQAYRDHLPAWLGILCGNGLFMLLYCFMERAIAITTRQRSILWWLLGLNVATLCNFAYYTFVTPSVMTRTIEAIFVTIAMQCATLWVLFRNRDKVIQPALNFMAASITFHACSSLLRGFFVWHSHVADAWFSAVGVITIAGTSLSFLGIDVLRTRHELQEQAMTDPLTGLLNRRALDLFAERELHRSTRAGKPYSALAIDINRFKEINDRYGHAAGDVALCAVATSLRSCLRTTDLATRIGGDEFFVILPDTDEDAAKLVVTRLRSTVEQLRLSSLGNQAFTIGISIGQVTCRGEHHTTADLLHASDIMLYREKQTSDSHRAASSAALRMGDQHERSGAQVHPSNT